MSPFRGGKRGIFCLLLTAAFYITTVSPAKSELLINGDSEDRKDKGVLNILMKIYDPHNFILRIPRSPESEGTRGLYSHYLMGVIFDNQLMYQKAAEEFLKAQQHLPDSEPLYLRRAIIYLKLKDHDRAKGCIDAVSRLNPKNLQAQFLLALLYADKKDYEGASRQYEKIIEQDPHNILALSSLADLYVFEKKLNEAVEIYKKLLEEERGLPQIYFNLGLIYLRLNQDKEAMENFKAALNLRPDYAEPILAIGAVEELRENYKEAVRYYRMAAEIEPENTILNLRIAGIYSAAEDYGRAVKEYKAIIDKDPQEIKAYIGLAEAYLRNHQNDKALAALDEAAGIDEEDPYMLLLFGVVYFEDKDYQKAIGYFKRGVKIEPSCTIGHFYLGAALERSGQRTQAKESLKKVIELNPDDAEALNYLGYMYAEDGENLDEAIALLERALKIEPQNGAFIDSLGWAYYKKGDLEKAKELIESAVRLYGDDPVIYDHLGDIYHKMGKTKKAKGAWERSLKLDPKQDKVKEKLKSLR